MIDLPHKIDVVEIRKVKVSETYRLRNEILRPNQPIESCQWNGDNDPSTFHLGAYVSDSLVGILSLYKATAHACPMAEAYQLRGMAIAEKARGRGYGKMLALHGESVVVEASGAFIWANARISALAFYQKLNYILHSERFSVDGVGLHVRVGKALGNAAEPVSTSHTS